ncbi:MAG: ATP-dependent DNA helicase RecG, partial [Wohlfahrtiimonas sp.]
VAQERLRILQQTEDGFVIAEKDLELRGTGEIIGTKQTGEVTFKVANIFQHKEIIEKAQKMVPKLLDNDEIVNGLIKRWLNHRTQFIHV